MKQPFVSILIPAYNAERWISDTIRSAIKQTWRQKEIIVVDDGSDDGTLRVAEKFGSDGVRVVSQSNAGAAAARNKAFSLSRGDYIQWLDADDLLSACKIERQMAALTEGANTKNTLVSGEWGYFMYRRHRAQFIPSALWCDLSPVEWLACKMAQNLHMQTATWLVSRELTERAGLWDVQLLGDDDGEYFCRVLLQSASVRFVPGARVYYRLSPHSLSYIGRSKKKMEAQWRSMRLHIQYLRSLEDTERTRAASVTYLQNWLLNFYPEQPEIVRQMEQLAKELGGVLRIPRLPWKYEWIRRLGGWHLAKRAQRFLPNAKLSAARLCDQALFSIENRVSFEL